MPYLSTTYRRDAVNSGTASCNTICISWYLYNVRGNRRKVLIFKSEVEK